MAIFWGCVLRQFTCCCTDLRKLDIFSPTPALPSSSLPPPGFVSLRVQWRANSLADTKDASPRLLLALLRTTGMAVITLYIAGYTSSTGMMRRSWFIQSTVCNGWMFTFLGTVALLGGQLPPAVRRAFLGTPMRLQLIGWRNIPRVHRVLCICRRTRGASGWSLRAQVDSTKY